MAVTTTSTTVEEEADGGAAETTTTIGDETTATTVEDDSSITEQAETVVEAGTGVGPKVVGEAAETVATAPLDALNKASREMADTAFGDLAEIGQNLGGPDGLVLGNLTFTVHMLAGFVAFAFILTTVAFFMIAPRRKLGDRLIYLGTSTAKYLVISSFGVAIGVALVELSARLTEEAFLYALPETINTDDANLYDAALAAVIVPLVGVVFEFQRFLVAILIAFWPLAAAVSIFKSFRSALPSFTALLFANCAWPPLAALAIGQAFAALPSVGTATWWCLAAVVAAPITNAICLNATKHA